MLTFRAKALKAMPLFFRPYNDIELYIEDKDDQVFYETFIGKLLEGHCKVTRVFPLNGRRSVLASCSRDQDEGGIPRLYLIDGDLDLIVDEPVPKLKRLLCLEVYCIENHLIDEKAAVQIVFENLGTESLSGSKARLKFRDWLNHISPPLIKLFLLYAIAHKLRSGIKTVHTALGSFLMNTPKGPCLDPQKVMDASEALKKALISDFGAERINKLEAELAQKWPCCSETALRIVSGKDFLLPLLMYHMKSAANSTYTTESTRLRLACCSSAGRMRYIQEILAEVSKGEIDFSGRRQKTKRQAHA